VLRFEDLFDPLKGPETLTGLMDHFGLPAKGRDAVLTALETKQNTNKVLPNESLDNLGPLNPHLLQEIVTISDRLSRLHMRTS
jgi:hypothetical protein